MFVKASVVIGHIHILGIGLGTSLQLRLMRGNVIKKRINRHSQLWDRADLDTSFLTLEKVHPNLKSKFIRTNFRSVLLDFQSFIEKPHFEYLQFCSSCIIFIISGYKHFGARLCCMQIGYEIVSNEHVSQLCSFNICNSMDSPYWRQPQASSSSIPRIPICPVCKG